MRIYKRASIFLFTVVALLVFSQVPVVGQGVMPYLIDGHVTSNGVPVNGADVWVTGTNNHFTSVNGADGSPGYYQLGIAVTPGSPPTINLSVSYDGHTLKSPDFVANDPTGETIYDLNIIEQGVPQSAQPTSDFGANVTKGGAPLTVQFSDLSTGSTASWNWSFGDGSPNSTDRNPAHTYSNPGVYSVSFTVAGPGGYSTKTANNYITVEAAQNTFLPASPAAATPAPTPGGKLCPIMLALPLLAVGSMAAGTIAMKRKGKKQ